MTSIADANGRTVTLDHGTDEYLDSATDDVGRTISFTWSGDRIASAFTEPVAAHGGPLTWRYYYDANDRLIEACDPRNNTQGTGVCTAFDYDAEDRLSSITKPEGNDEVVLGYDANGLVETRTDGENKTWTFARSTEFAVITTDPRGNTTCQEFDQEFRQIAEYDATALHTDGCNPAANKTTFGYDAEGYRNLIIDGNGNQSGLTYDADGNLLNETNGELETTYFEYDPNTDDLVAVRDGRSATALDTTYRTSYDYDPANRNLLSETDPLGNVTSWVYTDGTELAVGETAGETMPPGLLESSTSPRGNVTAEVGDFTTLYAYDQFGDLRSVSAPSGLVTEYTYDEIGRRLTTTVTDDLAGTVAVTSVTYDPVGNALTATGPSVSNSLSGQTTQARTTNIYDLNSNLELSTVEDLNANGVLARVTGFLYDLNDREKQVTDPELGVMVRQFDGNGNVTQVTDQNGTVIRTVYDARNLPVEVWLDNYRTDVSDVGDAGVSFQMSKSEYDLAGRLTSTTEYVRRLDNPTQVYSRVTETVYDQADRVDTVTLLDFDPVDGSALRPVLLSDNDYDKAGNLTRLTRGDGVANQLVTQMFYDDAGRLFQTVVDPVAVNPGGIDRTTVLSLDANGNPDVLTMSEGGRTETTTTLFDEADRAYGVTVENGATDIVTSVGYDERGNVVSSTDAKQKTSTSAFDEAGRLISMVAPLVPLNGTTPPVAPTGRYAYNVFGDQIMVEDPNGNVTTVDYDRLSRAEVITHPTYVVPGGGTLQPTELFAYDAVGNKTAETSRRDNTTTWTFDSLSQPTAQIDAPVTEADGITLRPAGTISNVYDSSGNLLETTDQRGAQTTFTYDLLNRVRTQTQIVRQDAAPAVDYVTVFDYDDLGNQTRVTTPFGLDTTTDYSPLGEALLVTDDEGNPTSFEYQFGRVIKVIDPLLRYTTFTYDLAGRQTDVQAFDVNDVELSHSASTYDANGNVETTISPRGFEPAANQAHYTTTYAYDGLNRLETVSQPVDGTTTITTAYGYDKAGNVTVAVDGNLNQTVYTYNAWHLRESIIEPETVVAEPPANRTFTTAYDGGGLPVTETMPGGVTVSRTFDELGRLRRVDGAGDGAASRVFDYDAAGFRTNVSYVDPVTDADIVYDFDDRGLLTGVSGPAGSATYLYDDDGRLRQRVDAAGTHVFDWTGANELQTLTDGVSDTTFTYGWDDASQIDTVTTNTGLTRDYAFDSLGRLDTDTLTDSGGGVLASFDYGYDTEFMTSKIVNLPGNAQSGSHDYEYDFAGRLSSWTNPIDGLVAYSWDGAGNRLTVGTDVYTYDERNRMETGPEGTYSYSPRGTMAALDTGTAIITYDFDSLGRLVDYNGEVSYTYDGLDRVAARNGTGFVYEGGSLDPISDGTFTYGRSPSGRLVSQTDGITPMLAGLDAHGDLSFLYSAVGVVSDTAMFDPFGDPAATTGTTSPTLGFQADFTDPVSEHVWMGSRWYDGGWAVFLSRDTVFGELRTPISLNRYTYAYANPISFFDPDGRLPQPMIDGVCAPGACGSITESDPITAQHETTVLSEGCNAAGYCEYGGTPATATDSVGLAQVEASRRKAGSSLTSEERIGIINGFFDEYPGSALYVGFDVSAASELGFGDAIAAFVEWEIESGRLADSEWWRVVNGNMMLDMRDAQSLLSRGVTTSDRPGVQAWINYALVASSDAPPHPRLCSQYQSTICHGTGERLNRLEQQQQAALWEAHNVSLHHGIDSSADLLAEETGNEQDFIQIVVNNVDRSVLANVPSSGPMPQGLLAPFYVAPGPSQFISEGIDIFGPWNLGPRYPQEYPAPSNWDSAMFVDMPCGFLALTGIPACAANIGLDSTRWRR